MFKKLKELFKPLPTVAEFESLVGSVSMWAPAIPVLSEHQRMRRELFSYNCNHNGVETAEVALEAFDKAFPDRDEQVVRLPRPRPDGCIHVGDIESQLDAAGVKYIPWNYVR